jgi:hypothetical protein
MNEENLSFKQLSENYSNGIIYGDSINELLNQKIVKKTTLTDLIEYLYLCDCCIRHQENKPAYFGPLKNLPMTYDDTNTCRCDCRHISRIICRQHNDYKGVKYLCFRCEY